MIGDDRKNGELMVRGVMMRKNLPNQMTTTGIFWTRFCGKRILSRYCLCWWCPPAPITLVAVVAAAAVASRYLLGICCPLCEYDFGPSNIPQTWWWHHPNQISPESPPPKVTKGCHRHLVRMQHHCLGRRIRQETLWVNKYRTIREDYRHVSWGRSHPPPRGEPKPRRGRWVPICVQSDVRSSSIVPTRGSRLPKHHCTRFHPRRNTKRIRTIRTCQMSPWQMVGSSISEVPPDSKRVPRTWEDLPQISPRSIVRTQSMLHDDASGYVWTRSYQIPKWIGTKPPIGQLPLRRTCRGTNNRRGSCTG